MSLTGKACITYDLLARNLLPPDWDSQIYRVVDSFARFVHLDGKNPESCEPQESQGMDYYVVTGDIASYHLPWLLSLYLSSLTDLASEAFGVQLRAANEIVHGININILKRKNARYEWHVDPNPVSGILYVTSHSATEGGGLIIGRDNNQCVVQPRSGSYVLFEGGKIPHAVAPLFSDQARISIPLLFYYADQKQVWPEGLSSYLYGI